MSEKRPPIEVADIPATKEEVLAEANRILETHAVDDASYLAALVVSLLETDNRAG